MAFLIPLALAAAAPSASAPSPERVKLVAELAAKCVLLENPPSDISLVSYAHHLVDLRAHGRLCRGRDEDLALRLARLVAEAPSPASGGAYGLLSNFFRGAHGMKSNEELARTSRRRAWLLGSRALNPFRRPAEARAYLADPETIAFLRGRLSRGAPPKERVWLAEALLARRGAGEVAEARILLRASEAVTEPAARLLLAELALEPGASPADIADAAARLRPVVPGYSGAEARPVIFRLARLQLRAAKTPEETWEAVQSLAAAAYAGDAGPLRAFREALLAANGGIEPATVDAVAPPARIGDFDYPPSAARESVSGVVKLRALVDPRGRIVFTQTVDPAQPKILVDTVRRVYASRTVPPLAIAVRPTPYVWVSVKPVAFRVSD